MGDLEVMSLDAAVCEYLPVEIPYLFIDANNDVIGRSEPVDLWSEAREVVVDIRL